MRALLPGFREKGFFYGLGILCGDVYEDSEALVVELLRCLILASF